MTKDTNYGRSYYSDDPGAYGDLIGRASGPIVLGYLSAEDVLTSSAVRCSFEPSEKVDVDISNIRLMRPCPRRNPPRSSPWRF
jgi:hypothetical protein